MQEVYSMNVRLQPDEVFVLVKESLEETTELAYEELHELGAGRMMGTLVYERYFYRTSNQAALVLIADNLKGVTNVRLIPAGSSKGIALKIDWGAGKSFASSVEQILSPYVIK